VSDLSGLLRPDVTQGSFGDRATLGCRQGFGGREPGSGPVEPDVVQHVVDRPVGHPPATKPFQPEPGLDGSRPFGGMLDGVGDDLIPTRGDNAFGCRPLGRGFGIIPASPYRL